MSRRFRRSVLIRFIAEKHRSHSAVLTGITREIEANLDSSGYIDLSVTLDTKSLSMLRMFKFWYVEESICFRLVHSD